MYFTFSQNNSGGFFETDVDLGISEYVIIEADNDKDANEKAIEIGLYFCGVDSGSDCECCGDRWYPVDTSDGTLHPEVYGKSPEQYGKGRTVVHRKNGKMSWF